MARFVREGKEEKDDITEEGVMQTYYTPVRLQGLALASWVFGVLGGVLYWWVPAGMVLSLAGLILGLFGWLIAPRGARGVGLVLSGLVVSIAALALDLTIAGLGLQTVTFEALR
jgi:hypothetical protein